MKCTQLEPSEFPSTYGEEVLKVLLKVPYYSQRDKFPSPYGEEVLKGQRMSAIAPIETLKVSVPLRGRGFERRTRLSMAGQRQTRFPSPYGEEVLKACHTLVELLKDEIVIVSVPLRGRGFERLPNYYINGLRLGFPSPYGEEVLKEGRQKGSTLLGGRLSSFRPLTGKRF